MDAPNDSVATLIGDIVDSKSFDNRARLQATLESALRSVNATVQPIQPLLSTIGDEFQGVFATVAEAVKASLLLRLELLRAGEVDSRYGLGYGEVTIFRAGSPTQDGPGWWSARAGIAEAEASSLGSRTAFVRTCFGRDRATALPAGETAALNAFLICRDAIVAEMSPRNRRFLRGLLLGRSQVDLAREEGVTQSAVSQALAGGGAHAIEAAESSLGMDGW
jgi:hypothetical protein